MHSTRAARPERGGSRSLCPCVRLDLVGTKVAAKKTGPRLVRIGVARDEVEAAIWRDALEQDGIAAFIRNVDTLAVAQYVGVSPLPYSLEVYVRAADARRARWVLGLDSPGEERTDS